MLRKNVLNHPAMRKHFGIFGGGLKLLGITKKSIPISQEMPGTAGNLNVNEQSKYKSDPILLRATRGAHRLILVSGTLWTVRRGFSWICTHSWHSWDASPVPTNMHGMWPRRPWCEVKVRRMSSNHVNAHALNTTIIIIDSQARVIQVHKYGHLNVRLFDSSCRRESIYLPRKMKVEPDLSLVQGKFSVRY